MQLKKSELKEMYEKNSLKDVAKKLGVSIPTLYRLLEEAGIEKKGSKGLQNAKKIKIVD